MPSVKALRRLSPTREDQPALHEAWTLLENFDAEDRKEQMIEEAIEVLEQSWRKDRKQPLPRGASQEEILTFMRDESVRAANATYRSAEASRMHEARQLEAAGEAKEASDEIKRFREALRSASDEVKRDVKTYRKRMGEEQETLESESEERLKAIEDKGQEMARRLEDAFDTAQEHTRALAKALQQLTDRSERAAKSVRRRRGQGPYWTAIGIGMATLVILAGLWLWRPGWALSPTDRAHLELGRRTEAAVRSNGAVTDRELEALEEEAKALFPGQGKASSQENGSEENSPQENSPQENSRNAAFSLQR